MMVAAWRLGLGPMINAFPRRMGRILVLTTVGRKSGVDRRTPLNFAPGRGCVYVLAGFGERSDWMMNLEAHPRCEVWLPDGQWEASAVPLTEGRERLLRIREVLQSSGFAAEAFAGIDPFRMGDQQLREKTTEYRVMRIDLARRRGPCPRDLAWVWPAMGLGVLAGLALWRGTSRKPRQG